MKTGKQLVEKALPHVGEKYVFGVFVPKNASNWRGAWDCAEFASWVVYQVAGILYGCANNNGSPDRADAYTGFWDRDAKKLGNIVTVDEAKQTEGAMLLRVAANGIVGHIAISDGQGGTVEAHSTKTGVIKGKVDGRRWDYGILIPQISYTRNEKTLVTKKPATPIYRLTEPYMRDANIVLIQQALGFKGKDIDGIYGNKTYAAVRAFQLKKGLLPDGEVGKNTIKALGIKLA